MTTDMTETQNDNRSLEDTLHLTDQTTLFLVDFHIWSGRKKLRAEDLRLGTDLPPDELISLGSKKICNPDALRVFHRNKKRIERNLLAVGTRFLGGFLVPNALAVEAQAMAEAITLETRAEAETFLADYDRHIDAWCAAYPGWEPAIRQAVDPVEVVRGQFRFRVQALRIETAPLIATDTLHEDVAEIGDTIFAEVEQMARGLEQSFLGKPELSQRALGTFRRIHDKLDALSFVDGRIDPVVRSIGQWLKRLPGSGPIRGGLFLEGWALMRLVGEAEAMARHGEGLLALDALMAELPEPRSDADVGDAVQQEDDANSASTDAEALPDDPMDFDDLFEEQEVPGPIETPQPPVPAAPAQDFWF
ncbi:MULTISPECIES: DUF3150 domain-containing protein [Thiorhodovibrio]|uniref:DUF3150 domain-containing protein n=1 Tax=Thiorhodovibrio TaxID=61593 RepID=UPI001912128B|nr:MULTISPECIES: DUF3150 domain-containing protein [Thiorhodovibrio]MBK5968808.1 hypothetical protein [Thiorhodovibrio winogradskyi]WPL12226.1 hypothetical protein Thiosp_01986 [Thiorhodovibrio litoralis]